MSPIAPALQALSAEIAERSGWLGRSVDVAALGITDRKGRLPLRPPGLRSPNGACRLIRAADGWVAVNLARDEDRDLVPAWLGCEFGVEPWTAIAALAGGRACATLVADAVILGLPVACVGEVSARRCEATFTPAGERTRVRPGSWRVVDLSALWAGPLCGAVLAAAGGEVLKVESVRRPDPTRDHTPEFYRRLNGGKAELRLDLADAADQGRLLETIAGADVLITSARPRGLASLGLTPRRLAAANPRLVWVAITGYGRAVPDRVAFGDDAAAAGGLVGWSGGAPRFLGDALADPLTGLAAAAAALAALETGRSGHVDAALARCAAGAAHREPAPA